MYGAGGVNTNSCHTICVGRGKEHEYNWNERINPPSLFSKVRAISIDFAIGRICVCSNYSINYSPGIFIQMKHVDCSSIALSKGLDDFFAAHLYILP